MQEKSPIDPTDLRRERSPDEWRRIESPASKKKNAAWHLAKDHIGSVLVQRARKWDGDRKQIQITAVASETVADRLCKLNVSNRFWFRAQREGGGGGSRWKRAGGGGLSSEKMQHQD